MNVDVDFVITEGALEKIKQARAGSFENSLLRVFVQGGGCSGNNYSLAFVDPEDFNQKEDVVHEFGDVKVVVNRKGLFLLDGTTMDWDDSRDGFKFNETSSKSCGCKKSCS